MKSTLRSSLVLLLLAVASELLSNDLIPGDTLRIVAEGDTGLSYHVYVPSNYDEKTRPPLLIAFSPSGNGSGILKKLKGGIEEAGWILVGVDQLKNGMKDPLLARKMEDELLDDVFSRLPHNPERVYLGGFSGGAWRAYHLTTRRPESFAGILAYGGWLGGTEEQEKPYRSGISVAMINGTHDRGANAWMPIDTVSLRKRQITVKHFAFPGGHSVAQVEITKSAVNWMNEEWERRASGGVWTGANCLDLLYVGDHPARSKAFTEFLKPHFRTVTAAEADKLTLELANEADVLLLDQPVRTLPDNFTKATLLTPRASEETARRYGSKYKRTSEASLGSIGIHLESLEDWTFRDTQQNHLISSRAFKDSEDSQIIVSKGEEGALIVREAHRLYWGWDAVPSQLSKGGQEALIEMLSWIFEFNGHQQSVFANLTTRERMRAMLDQDGVDLQTLRSSFAPSVLEQHGETIEALRRFFAENGPYLVIRQGSGLLELDENAKTLGTPNHRVDSIESWIKLLSDETKSKTSIGLLHRYTGKRIRKNQKLWREWFAASKEHLSFRDDLGYRFVSSASGP
ncbi:hypothetical protein [Pelagicoccus mobilis]|uniref:Uncharacterized protein n=1 Tax=Pelagicoccus mobilis TaxID=415221 RepID=A0A934VPS2_9BACT|nr:hypothetical protein [Pelagicoccus mobilis]MBK1875809.1 hypothetical protein [Pelagicoccus mobilis]